MVSELQRANALLRVYMANATIVTPSSSHPGHIQFTHQIRISLDHDNYLLWRAQVLPALKGHKLGGYLDGSTAPPNQYLQTAEGLTINPAFDLWQQQDQLILAWLLNSLSTPILAQVVSCDTTSAIWLKIEQIYSSQTVANTLDLKLQLQTVKKGSRTCAQYLQLVQSLADKLRSIGEQISDRDLVLQTLQGLGTEFDSFVTSATMRPTLPTMAELSSFLLTFEARQLTQLKALTSTDVHLTALNSQHTINTNGQTGTQHTSQLSPSDQQVFCAHGGYQHNRGRGNRGRNNFRGRGRGRHFNNYSGQPNSSSQPCQICHKWGHDAIDCYHRFDVRFSKQSAAHSGNNSGFSSPNSASSSTGTSQHQALLAVPSNTPSSSWFLDSGATTHVTADINNMVNSQPYSGSDTVHIGNGTALPISHIGNSVFSVNSTPIYLRNMLHVPAITKNLISISQLLHDNKLTVEFFSDSCVIKDPQTHKTLLLGTLSDGLYKLDLPVNSLQHQLHYTTQASSDLWHYKLARCSFSVLDKLKRDGLISLQSRSLVSCMDCNKAKAHKLPFTPSHSSATSPLEVIHSNVWGPSPEISYQGNRYYVLFVDEFTRFSWLFSMCL